MKFLDLFAGIGGFRLGMERAGHECAGYVEIDKFARKSYQAIHDTEGEWTREDITKITDGEWRTLHGTVDVICGGFPCQSFSVAGKRLGFEETRGTLFFEIARAAKQIQSRYLFLENVKGLLSHNEGETFATILTTLDELGYDAEWRVLNSKNHGVPHNRERVFIIGHLRGTSGREIFPLAEASRTADESRVIANTLTARYPYNQREGTYIETARKSKQVMPVLTPDRIIKRQNGRRFKCNGEEMFTLTAQDKHGVLIREATLKGYAEAFPGDSVNISHPNSKTRRGRVGKQVANTLLTGEEQAIVTEQYRIRKLTPRECWRLQGFPDWAFDRAAEVNSNSQLYKQAGNSVTVNVIENIARLFKEETK
ncbi:DNA (cytosine-5-)-methyltransferase [Listeria monocytogenes]|uniref:DNA (cytosine-5-)-methyltransferase n=1 Tax=Listeria monocytogenes TaxID=1639 RepID=UPI001382E464|nr:DNA (cytosine-5-)-methyltransferase [Listeria monocytogenes]EBD1544186.1 DNA (cytosine-5-)-methyltransferase [Listeria monocytogenes]EDH0851084.1 DNA (cytosine-5-)-methyltransferase [Listeria monocytogenes]EGC2961951.1 DNA (cytosine-5-)-methyltransferase [Listeria monocytogenes]EGC2994281.1 DNA (cytosine-5-)-methyltransferase [Listeria monocytogenes]